MERAQFDEHKAILLEKVKSGLDQLQTNLNAMNRNLETINAIGTQFEAPSHLWSSFHKAIDPTNEAVAKQSTDTIMKEISPLLNELEEKSIGEE